MNLLRFQPDSLVRPGATCEGSAGVLLKLRQTESGAAMDKSRCVPKEDCVGMSSAARSGGTHVRSKVTSNNRLEPDLRPTA